MDYSNVGADKIGCVLQTKIGELEVDPDGNYNINCFVSETPRDDRIALRFHTNHRSEDIEMSMFAGLDPYHALILYHRLGDFLEETLWDQS